MTLKSVCVVISLVALASGQPFAQSAHRLTKADIDLWMQELSNWGRWGADDQLGTLNLITNEKRRQAAALVTEGYSVSLAHDVLTAPAVDNAEPFAQTMLPARGSFRMDRYSVAYHGMSLTHLDALCHASYQGKLFNGYSLEQTTEAGCASDSILVARAGLFTRGVLMDFAWLKGVAYLEPGTAIYPEDLAEWEKRTGVTVGPGDAVFVRTGRWSMRAAMGPGLSFAGLHASTARWLHDRGVALLGGDADPEVAPSQVEGVALPIHQLALVAMGLPLFDNCDLEELGRQAARRNRWLFLLTASPLPVPGGTGSPMNPIATF
jgi:kynurenine formamidase